MSKQQTYTRIDRPRYDAILDVYRDTEQVKVLQGMRRCGKSTLLAALRDRLMQDGVSPRNIFYRRFDEFSIPLVQTAEGLAKDLQEAFDASDQSEMFYVFLDEIQEIDGWERLVRGLHTRARTDVYLTGSNARMLSSDLATQLSGRQVTIMVYPLSFEEYLSFEKAQNGMAPTKDEAFGNYLRFGGMPSLFSLRERSPEFVARELSSISNTIILNDVARRLNIRDITLLQRLVTYLFSTTGSLFSTNSVVKALKAVKRSISPETVEAYLLALEQAFIIAEAPQFGLQGKEILNPLRKFYPADPGLKNLATNFAVRDTGFLLENVVYVELARRGYSVSVGALRAGEVDFVTQRGDERRYIQVSESLLGEQVRQREIEPLEAIGDSFPKVILTLDRIGLGTTESGIRIVNIIDWLLHRDS